MTTDDRQNPTVRMYLLTTTGLDADCCVFNSLYDILDGFDVWKRKLQGECRRKADTGRIIELHLDGEDVSSIADKTGSPKGTVRRILMENGLTKYRQSYYTSKEINKIIDMRKNRKGIAEIATKMNRTYSSVESLIGRLKRGEQKGFPKVKLPTPGKGGAQALERNRIELIRKLYTNGDTPREIARKTGHSLWTVNKYIRGQK